MEINKNQLVVFTETDGTERKLGYTEVRYSERSQSFYVFSDIEERTKLYSNIVIDKPIRKKREYTKQTDTSKMKEIFPCGETEKAYQVFDGSNGHVGKTCKSYYKYYAKSICVVDNNKIYAPLWA